jgi:hypothetical protein
MYTATMSPEEIHRETQSEIPNIIAKSNHMTKEFRRRVLKATKFPISMTYEQHTVRKNRWKVTMTAMSKGNIDGRTIIMFYCINESELGKFIYAPIPSEHLRKGEYKTMVFKPHFFSRYRERMGTEEDGEQLIQRLLSSLEVVNFQFENREDGTVGLIVNLPDGQGFGEAFYHKCILLIRTFVPKNMLFENQISQHEEGLSDRQKVLDEAHEHMYNFDRNVKKKESEIRGSYQKALQGARQAYIDKYIPEETPKTSKEMFEVLDRMEQGKLLGKEQMDELRRLAENCRIEEQKLAEAIKEYEAEEEHKKKLAKKWGWLVILLLPLTFLLHLFNRITGKNRKKKKTTDTSPPPAT